MHGPPVSSCVRACFVWVHIRVRCVHMHACMWVWGTCVCWAVTARYFLGTGTTDFYLPNLRRPPGRAARPCTHRRLRLTQTAALPPKSPEGLPAGPQNCHGGPKCCGSSEPAHGDQSRTHRAGLRPPSTRSLRSLTPGTATSAPVRGTSVRLKPQPGFLLLLSKSG